MWKSICRKGVASINGSKVKGHTTYEDVNHGTNIMERKKKETAKRARLQIEVTKTMLDRYS